MECHACYQGTHAVELILYQFRCHIGEFPLFELGLPEYRIGVLRGKVSLR